MGQGASSGPEPEPVENKQVIVIHCPHCNSYLQPSLDWVKSSLGPAELLHSWVTKGFKNPMLVELLDPKPYGYLAAGRSKTIGIKFENQKIAEYIIDEQSCHSCSHGHDDDWEFAVQLRQNAPHNNGALVDLLPRLYSYDRLTEVAGIKHFDGGFDFFYKSIINTGLEAEDASCELVTYLESLLPMMYPHRKKLTLDNPNGGDDDPKTIFCLDICPMYLDDLILVPQKVVQHLRMSNPLALCLKFNSKITLLDTSSLSRFLTYGCYFSKAPFMTLFSRSQLVEFRIRKVNPIDPAKPEPEYVSAYAEVSDCSNVVVTVKTHLGRVLRSGDYALGYDLRGLGRDGFSEYENLVIPDVILVKKSDRVDLDPFPKFQKISKCDHLGRSEEVNKVLYRKRDCSRTRRSMFEVCWADFTCGQLEEFLLNEEKAL